MLNLSRKRKQFMLFLLDLLFLLVAIPLTLFFRKVGVPSSEKLLEHLLRFIPLIAFWLISMYTTGFYVLEKPFNSVESAFSLSIIAILTMLCGFGLFYLIWFDITPKTVLVIYCSINWILLTLWRYIYTMYYQNYKSIPTVFFAGYTETVEMLIPELLNFGYLKYHIVGVYDPSIENKTLLKKFKIPYATTEETFKKLLQEKQPNLIILAQQKEFSSSIRTQLFSLLNKEVLFYSLPHFFEAQTRRIALGSINDLWLLSHIKLQSKKLFFIAKRVFDICISLVGIILFFIPGILIAFIIKIDDPEGPILFTQIREGKDSVLFTLLKFRTMKVTNNSYAPTEKKDTRITRVGSFLRTSRLDEIPQFINVIKGNMSIIGPRPERPELAIDLEKKVPFYRQRLLVKPGITGWDQVSGEYHSPSIEDTVKKLQFDLYYIKNSSILLDLSIFFKTIKTIFLRRGQ